MKAGDFAYERPSTLQEALLLLNQPDVEAVPLAGGQSLMPVLNFRFNDPDLLVDLNGVAALCGISDGGDYLQIGAMTRHNDLPKSPLVQKHAPLLASAVSHVAHPAIRNRGTIGGSVALADPAAELPACLIALDANIIVAGPTGDRTIAAERFFRGLYETALASGELIVAFEVPKIRPDQRISFKELTRRHGDYAMTGLAAVVSLREDARGMIVCSSRLAGFGISDRPLRLTAAERALNGLLLGTEECVTAVTSGFQELEFHGDLQASPVMKRHLLGVLTRRALEEMAQ